MSVHIRKMGASKQIHESGDKGVCHVRAVIDEHGYSVKVTAEMNYNAMSTRRVPHAHKAFIDTVMSALDTAAMLRDGNPAMISTDELTFPETEQDSNHA